MKAVYRELVDNSLAAAVSAIEIYNKPDFKYRNETFVILAINAWELLLKAKLIKDNGKNSVFIKDGSRYKTSRTGNRMTLEIRGVMRKLSVDNLVIENIESLLEIRDTAIHFYNKETISYAIFALGAATLQNYQRLVKEWFGVDLAQYNFYILPLGFKYSFKNFSVIDLSKEPEAVQNLLGQIVAKQSSGDAESNGYYLVADIKAEVISAKKVANEEHLKIAIDTSADTKGIIRTQKITDRYPYSSAQLWEQVHENLPNIKQPAFYKFLKENNMRTNPKYAAYNFRTKKQEDEYNSTKKVPKGLTPIYNQDALEFIITSIEV